MSVTFQRNLSWHEHVDALPTSVVKKLGFLFGTKKYLSPFILYTVCHSGKTKSRVLFHIQGLVIHNAPSTSFSSEESTETYWQLSIIVIFMVYAPQEL